MKKLFLYILIFSFVHQMLPENKGHGVLTKIKEVIHNKNTLFSIGKYSISEGKAIVGVWGLTAIFILLKFFKKIFILKSSILSKYRREKISKFLIEPSWVYPDYVKNKYSKEVEKNLLKFREKLWKGYKNLLDKFQKDMDIDNPKFIEYLITEAEGEENYLKTEHKRTRVIDQNIPNEILNFIDVWLSKVNINPGNVNIYAKKLGKKDNISIAGTASTTVSFVLEERKGEKIDINKTLLHEYQKSTKQLDQASSLFKQEKENYQNINNIQIDKKKLNARLNDLKEKLITSAYYSSLLKHKIFQTLLHEIGHSLMQHHSIELTIKKEAKIKSKNIHETWFSEVNRYQEFMADSLLALLNEDAAKTMLKQFILKAIYEKHKEKNVYFYEYASSKLHMSQKSSFILYADIIQLYGVTLEDCIYECFSEMKIYVPKTEIDILHDSLNNIYQSADPEFYTQTYSKTEKSKLPWKQTKVIEEEFKFPRFLPHLLEKQFSKDVAIKK